MMIPQPPARIQKHVLTRGAWSQDALARAAARAAKATVAPASPLLAKPIQNAAGAFFFLCGISRCGGGDVCGE